ncbi:MAG: type I restriction enzyme HsdR N-terminal domain-containing protein [Cyanobacteria bacterium J06648_16]
MIQTIAARDVTLRELKRLFGLQMTQSASFFTEWSISHASLTDTEQQTLDRVKANFADVLADPPALENTVKLVVLASLLDLAGFYRRPSQLKTETSIEIESEDDGVTIRGRIDILVLKQRLWLLVIESKRSDFAVTRAIPQALAYMLSNANGEQPTFGMITNGSEFLFLKAIQSPEAEYANSRLFSLVNPGNDLYEVLQVLKAVGKVIVAGVQPRE